MFGFLIYIEGRKYLMHKFHIHKEYIFLLVFNLFIFYFTVYSQDTSFQDTSAQDTSSQIEKSKEPTLDKLPVPVKCIQVININHDVHTLAVDSKGSIYHAIGYKVEVYNPVGEKESEFPLNNMYCVMAGRKESTVISAIDIDDKDNIYLCDAGNMTLEIFTKPGEFSKKIVLPITPKKGWYGIWDVVADDKIYVPAHFKFVYIFDKDGNLLRKWAKSESETNSYNCVTGIAIGRFKNHRDKRIYVADGYASRVYVYNKDDKKLLFSFGNKGTGLGEMIDIEGIDIDSDGRIYVLDRGMGYC